MRIIEGVVNKNDYLYIEGLNESYNKVDLTTCSLDIFKQLAGFCNEKELGTLFSYLEDGLRKSYIENVMRSSSSFGQRYL